MQTKTVSPFYWLLGGLLALLYVLSLGAFLYGNIQAGDSAPWQLITSGVLLSIPLVILYALLGMIIIAIRQKRRGPLEPRLARLVYWLPRVASLLIIFFVSLFSLDVFEGDASLGEKVGGFFIHSLPAIGLGLMLVLAWRWEWVGMVAFASGALFFLRFVIFDVWQGLGVGLLFGGPMIVIAILFGLNWFWRPAKPRPTG